VSRLLLLLPEVAEELREAARYYEDRSEGLGSDLERAFYAALPPVTENPDRFRRLFGEFRRVLLKRFPYLICYRAEENLVVVITLIHTARNPEELKKRLRERWR